MRNTIGYYDRKTGKLLNIQLLGLSFTLPRKDDVVEFKDFKGIVTQVAHDFTSESNVQYTIHLELLEQ